MGYKPLIQELFDPCLRINSMVLRITNNRPLNGRYAAFLIQDDPLKPYAHHILLFTLVPPVLWLSVHIRF